MLSFALVVLGISRDDFDWMLPMEYFKCVEMYDKKKESEIKTAYEFERFNSWLNLAPHTGKRLITEIFQFPWEENKKAKVTSWRGQRNTRN